MSNSNYILPFCVYHKFDRSTNSLYGYIGNSQKDKNGEFKCESYKNDWELMGTFYAVNPTIRPIPPGMNLFNVKRNEGFPYNSTELTIDYDFYFIKKDSVYFLTYGNIINKFTVPLYFFKNGQNLLPSFYKPDSTKKKFWDEWTELELSPLYVITEK